MERRVALFGLGDASWFGVDRRLRSTIEENAELLLRSDMHRSWWRRVVRQARRQFLVRSLELATVLLVLGIVSVGVSGSL